MPRRRKPKYRAGRQLRVLMLHAEGKSLRAIAREVGVSHQTVANDLRDAAKLSNLAVKKRPRRGPEFDTGFDTATVVSFQRRKP